MTVSADGGDGGNPWIRTAPGGFTGARHGPGGGGAGGVIFLSSAPASSSAAGGINGVTTQSSDAYGATPGAAGVVNTAATIPQTPGTQPGAYCAGADLSVTNSGAPLVVAPGGTITFTQSATNNSTFDAVNAVFSEPIPANYHFRFPRNSRGLDLRHSRCRALPATSPAPTPVLLVARLPTSP